MKMEIFEYTKLTRAGDKLDEDGQRVEVFWPSPVSLESFDSCNVPIFLFKREVVGCPRKKPVFMLVSAFSW